MRIFGTFKEAIKSTRAELKARGYEVRTDKWQGLDMKARPEAAMRELLNWSFQVPLQGLEDREHWQKDIGPNLPFADNHFMERIGGEPTNPGEAWKTWPWGNAADAHRTENGQFTHTYQERIWPKYAGIQYHDWIRACNQGIRYNYGDLNDLIEHLKADPFSRQAYLPIWFPEDGTCPGRKPCTLGYHFINRHGYLHITYYIRSCDVVRHFPDDLYLTTRLLLHVLSSLRDLAGKNEWHGVRPGFFTFHCVSMHCFINDVRTL